MWSMVSLSAIADHYILLRKRYWRYKDTSVWKIGSNLILILCFDFKIREWVADTKKTVTLSSTTFTEETPQQSFLKSSIIGLHPLNNAAFANAQKSKDFVWSSGADTENLVQVED